MTDYDYNSSLTLKDIDYINVNEMKEPVFQRSGLCRVLQDQEDQDPELLSDQVQGDPSGWLQPPVDLVWPSCLGSRAVGGYSSGPPAAGTFQT